MDKDIQIAKIVANSTPTSWSQAYNAGKLFAVISLTTEAPSEESSLNMLGKEILDNLEAEYFATPQKNMETIGNAVKTSLEKAAEGIKVSFVVGSIVENVLYAFAKNGRVELRRKRAFGKILEAGETLESSSGFLEEDDIILLETSEFTNLVKTDDLSLAIDSNSASQIAENLAPLVHEKSQGGASTIFIQYKNAKETEAPPPEPEKIPEEQTVKPESKLASREVLKNYFYSVLDKTKGFRAPSLGKPRQTILIVTVILLLVLLGSIIFALNKQNDEKTKALVMQYYTPAVKKYEEGQSLLDLNESLTRDSFMASQKLLLEGEPKFGKGSKEQKNVQELLKKINEQLEKTANIKTVSPTEVSLSESKLLDSERNSKVLYSAKEDSDIYTLDESGVNKNGKQIIKNAWGAAGGLGIYFGNVYVLDKSAKQILKFVSTSSQYVKTNYFKDSPGVSQASGIAIDGSVWVLLKDGTVMRFTKGASDNFSLLGLDKPFSSPTRIFTNVNMDNVYILDNGNSRIVVFDKTGAYKEQYSNKLFKEAKDIEVTKDKIYILSDSKIYSFEL